ncbi:TPA: hypothetical protein ACXJQT_003683 [Clostridioides difficile]|mgnify:CR=1 FL=1
MEITLDNPIYSTHAAMKIFRPQAIPGTLYLLRDRVHFQANGILKNSEIRSVFYYKDIKNIQFGFSFSPFRVVITEKNGENWIFDQVPRKEGKKFVEVFHTIKESNY